MAFGQIEISILDADGRPGPPRVVGVNTSNAGEGDWVTYDGRHYRILTPHHIEEGSAERTPRLRTRFYLQEGTPPSYFLHDDDGGGRHDAPIPIRPGVAKLYSLPPNPPHAVAPGGADEPGHASRTRDDASDKKVLAVDARPDLLAKTVPRPLSQSQVYEVFSAAVMAEAVPSARAPRVITTGGQVMDAMPSGKEASSATVGGHSTIKTTRHFELNSRDPRPTLRLVRTARTTIAEGLEAPALVEIERASSPEVEPAQSTNLTTPDAVPVPTVVSAHRRAGRGNSFASFAAPMTGVIILAVAVVFLIEAPYRREASSLPPAAKLPTAARPAVSVPTHAMALPSTAETLPSPTSASQPVDSRPEAGEQTANVGAKVHDDAWPLAVAARRRRVKAKRADDNTGETLTRSSRSAASSPPTETRRPLRDTDDAIDPDF